MSVYNGADLSALQIIGKQLSMESMAQESFVAGFSDFVSSIYRAFKGTSVSVNVKSFLRNPVTEPASKEHKKFLELVNSVPFAQMRPIRAYVPEGMTCTYMEILDPLLESSEYLKGLYAQVIYPYSLYLARFLSDKDTALSPESKRFDYAKLEQVRDARIASFTKLYKSDSYKTDTTVGAVISRNADWSEVLQKQKAIVTNLQAVDTVALKKEVEQCAIYLSLIADNLKKGGQQTRPEAAERLALGAYQVAKEVEYFSNTYYRALGVNAAISKTVDGIVDIFG